MASAKKPDKHSKQSVRQQKVFFAGILIVFLLLAAICFFLFRLMFPAGEDASLTPTPSPEARSQPSPVASVRSPSRSASAPTPTPAPTFVPRTATIRAGGDVMVHDLQREFAEQSDGTYDFFPQFYMIADSLADADYTILNLETTIGLYKDQDYSGYPLFNAPEELLDALKDSGVDFLTLANNHILDRYFDGMVATIDHVEERGFDFAGANRTQEEKDTPKIVEVNGIRIGFLCYTQITNGMEEHSDPKATEFGVNYLKKADLSQDVQALRDAGAEVVIAMPHWGAEDSLEPTRNSINYATRMAAAGVDIVLGSHPHVIQPVEMYTFTLNGEEKQFLVAYSLGNFISNMTRKNTYAGILLEFTLVEKEEGGFLIEDVGYVPVYCWRERRFIRTIPSAKYYEQKPEGMSDSDFREMRKSAETIAEVVGDEFTLLLE
ncbi:MAG TPA: CapA family protein [Candidatus Pullichristensenella excrementigallinarum]|uniref:CapA family protein n=1 Tax=Candidatus Pullichristensenella excrementigallinarum TaxID=2840907 RepID=A0A9D1IC75_9FIRM|nr:CapA family protein [Candidatus Pullichristensenella excrementigallinarum]